MFFHQEILQYHPEHEIARNLKIGYVKINYTASSESSACFSCWIRK